MPHVIVEYSGNMEDRLDMAAFCDLLRRTAIRIDALPLPGVRVRAIKVDHVSMADGDPQHGFIDISVRMRGGRSDAVKQDIAARLFEAARAFAADDMAQNSLALSLEVRDIDPALSPKTGSVRDHLKGQE